jgi:hypothetical protein
LRLKAFIFFLILIGLIASFYMPGINIRVRAEIYANTCSPYSIDWSGTSILVKRLINDGFKVIIVNNVADFYKETARGGLLLIIAPDKNISSMDLDLYFLRKLVFNNTINIAVFDENTTSNALLSMFGAVIDGRMILDPMLPQHQYPLTIIKVPGDDIRYVRLNWASYIHIANKSIYYEVFAETFGALDLNNNGEIDDNERETLHTWMSGAIIYPSNTKSAILIMSDSSPLINSEMGRNFTVSIAMYKYIEKLALNKGRRIIIPNFLYRKKSITKIVPFHSSILFLLIAGYTKNIEDRLDTVYTNYSFLEPLTMIALILLLMVIFKSLTGIERLSEYNITPTKEYRIIIESLITTNILDKKVLRHKEKILIANYWRILCESYKYVKNIDLENIISAGNYEALTNLGLIDRKSYRKLYWLYRIYLKSIDKRKLPIIISWRRTLFKYVHIVEEFLNIIGYTIFRREGFKDAKYILK